MKKKICALISALTALLCVIGLAGCSTDKVFEKAGMQITLTSSFHEKELISQTAYYESRMAIVTCLKEEFYLLPGSSSYSISEYTDIVLRNNSLSADVQSREGQDYLYFTYEKTVSGNAFFYLATTHKAGDAFWLIQFACYTSQKDNKTETFLKWADTVTFVGSAE
ncbi:MAG: hypothetical protein K2L12_03510 [Clostridia bacterium]|nr:hypothetical protein [Clostridia bacterium]